jgi:hypothetical protein
MRSRRFKKASPGIARGNAKSDEEERSLGARCALGMTILAGSFVFIGAARVTGEIH